MVAFELAVGVKHYLNQFRNSSYKNAAARYPHRKKRISRKLSSRVHPNTPGRLTCYPLFPVRYWYQTNTGRAARTPLERSKRL